VIGSFLVQSVVQSFEQSVVMNVVHCFFILLRHSELVRLFCLTLSELALLHSLHDHELSVNFAKEIV